MLLMDIVTWEPKDSEKVAELYANYKYPENIKVINEWFDLTGYRLFVVYEADDEKTYASSVLPFMGFCRFETFPIMKAEKYMQLAQKLTKEMGVKKTGPEESKGAPEVLEQIEKLEKRIERLEHHSFVQQEDTT